VAGAILDPAAPSGRPPEGIFRAGAILPAMAAQWNVAAGRFDSDGTLRLLGERHVLHLLYLLFEKSPRGFTELKVQAVVNTATLTDRLKRLEGLGIIQRRVIRALPRRVEYGITPRGEELLPIFRTIAEWRAKYGGLAVSELLIRVRA
jgi:DNA-binding HxlR family transcriptional regulator